MQVFKLALISFLVAVAPALAHPGHGKPGFIHSHTWAQLADWLANGALVVAALFFLFAVGMACRKLGLALSGRKK